MEFAYTPHREGGGALHIPSPSHPHDYHLENFSIKQIRRSLSRSPSKPSRVQLRPASESPISPLALSRAFSPKSARDAHSINVIPVSPLPHHSTSAATTSKKNKFAFRRSTQLRLSPRKSPRRRALGDSINQGNTTVTRGLLVDDNGRKTTSQSEKSATEVKSSAMRLDLDDGPIKFEFARPKAEGIAPGKSSPLKRSDGIMNLDQASLGSPIAKRRSLHGASSSGSESELFDNGPFRSPESSPEPEERPRFLGDDVFPVLTPTRTSPIRKPLSLRKSTIQQRYGSGTPRKQPAQEHAVFPFPIESAPRPRPRVSLDSAVVQEPQQSPFRRSAPLGTPHPFPQNTQFSSRNGHSQPHPLSKALSPPSSSSSVGSPTHPPPPAPSTGPAKPAHNVFSRSLPLGAMRPSAPINQSLFQENSTETASFATPEAYKMARPLPAAFMSTGLISKRNRNVEAPQPGSFASYAMPDTPSKRVSFPPMNASPLRTSLGKSLQLQHEFGTPTTPFSPHAGSTTPLTFGKGGNIFGTQMGSGLNRRGSFVSIDSDDNTPPSPCAHNMDSQSSADELPPTPTKPTGGRSSRENSLRSSLFGRRSSLGPDTFAQPAPPKEPETPGLTINGSKHETPPSGRMSPHTPQEHFLPDPSGLSISAKASRRGSIQFNSSLNSNASFPPATPTAPREHKFYFSNGPTEVAPIAGLTHNDVDTSLTARFNDVTLAGNGEFSQVYRVRDPVQRDSSTPAAVGSVWAVKKTKKPYTGMKDRERKLREVHILSALRGHDHIISFADSWEAKGHLYIQTEYCENGNLKDFLTQTGYKGRLDDFRIWKILLELSLGVKYIHDSGFIHLDLKPANVFIEFEGGLKIGDFGLASTWPAPPNIDGEGDREYIGPEILSGRFDKPADIFALGMIMLEIAGNIVLPDNGASWQRLRAGDLRDLPSLTFSSDSTLARDEAGDPVDDILTSRSNDTMVGSDGEDNTSKFFREFEAKPYRPEELVQPPRFMIDPEDPEALDRMVQWMIHPDPDQRPVIDQIYHCGGVQWVEKRRRSGATIYEGNWGPADDVLNHDQDVDMMDLN